MAKIPPYKKTTNDVFSDLSDKQDAIDKANYQKKIQSEIKSGLRKPDGTIDENHPLFKNQWNPALVQKALDAAATAKQKRLGNESYFSGGLRIDEGKDPVTGKPISGYGSTVVQRKDASGNIMPGLYESRDVQAFGKNDVPVAGSVGSKIQYVESVDPKTGQKSLISVPQGQYKPNTIPNIQVANQTPTLIQTAGQTDKEALSAYNKNNPIVNQNLPANPNTFVPKSPSGSYKKGGLIAKMRKYAEGGDVPETDPSGKPLTAMPTGNPGMPAKKPDLGGVLGSGLTSAAQGAQAGSSMGNTESAIGAGLGFAGEAVPSIINSSTQDVYGRYNRKSKAGNMAAGFFSGELGGAAKGAALGSSFGPLGMGIGAAAGAGLGGIMGLVKARQDQKSIEAEKQAEALAKNKEQQRIQNAKLNSSLNQQFQQRGFNKGGLVQKLSKGGNMDEMIENHNNNHLTKRVKEIGREAAMQEYNDYFAGSNKKQFRIK